jgi:hypothetical protein
MVAAVRPVLFIDHPKYKGIWLTGAVTLTLTDQRELRINLRHSGWEGETACNFWVRAPIQPGSWALDPGGRNGHYRITLSVDQYEVEQGCGSRYGRDGPMTLDFVNQDEGEKFVSVMTAVASGSAAETTAPAPPP